MAAMLVYSQHKNYFFRLGHQHGRYVYCLLCLLGLRENQEYLPTQIRFPIGGERVTCQKPLGKQRLELSTRT